MKINDLLDQLETVILTSSKLPFVNKRIVEEDDLFKLIDAMHDALPVAIMEADRIMAEKDRISLEANKAAQDIVDQSKEYVARLVDEHVIAEKAKEEGERIIAEAREHAETLQDNAVRYADDVFKYLEEHLEQTAAIVRRGHEDLKMSAEEEGK